MLNFTYSKPLVVCFILLINACSSGNQQTDLPTTITTSPPVAPVARPANEANVKEVNIHLMESFPLRVNVVIRGELPDGCTALDQFTQERRDHTFVIKILTAHRTVKACTQAIQPFDQVIPLEIDDLKAGIYTVEVNGVTESFELNMDNVNRH